MDFRKLIVSVLKRENLDEIDYLREYVPIQDADMYSKDRVHRFLKSIRDKKIIFPYGYVGYRGIITNDYYFIRLSTGEDKLLKRFNNEQVELFWTKEDYEECVLDKFKELVPKYPVQIIDDDKFRWSRYLHKMYKKHEKYLKEDLLFITKLLDKWLLKYPDNSVAIRPAGYHSKIMCMLLSSDAKKKIKCFIDRDKINCACSKMGIPIMNLDECLDSDVSSIVLSSFYIQDMLRKEAENYSDKVDVVDFYQFLEEEGYSCKRDFFWEFAPDDLFDVGFPFDEE